MNESTVSQTTLFANFFNLNIHNESDKRYPLKMGTSKIGNHKDNRAK